MYPSKSKINQRGFHMTLFDTMRSKEYLKLIFGKIIFLSHKHTLHIKIFNNYSFKKWQSGHIWSSQEDTGLNLVISNCYKTFDWELLKVWLEMGHLKKISVNHFLEWPVLNDTDLWWWKQPLCQLFQKPLSSFSTLLVLQDRTQSNGE